MQEVFSPNVSPAITVSRGETIVVETQDCYRGLLTAARETGRDGDRSDQADRADRAAGIPVTGPIYVEEAHIGDVLSIQVKQISTADKGVFAVCPETGVPGQDIQKPGARVLEVNEDHVQLDDRLKLPLRPVIGNLGVAAKHGEIDTVYPGRHGGNMDTLEITTGSRVYLPVQVNGALLSLGDIKACVGDGQIAGSGVEVEAEVTLRVDTLPGGRFSWPRVESKGEWVTITSASTVDQAARLAITEMVKWITQDKGLDFDTAYALVSLGGSLRVSQWGNPLITARMVFPKRLINKLKSVPTASGRLNYRTLPPAANGGTGGETVAEEAGQTAGRSSRRSGSGRSQRSSSRSRQSGGRRGTRQKSNGASSSASAESSQQEAAPQQEAASRQEAAPQPNEVAQPDVAAQPDDTVQQEAAPKPEAASRQEAAPKPDEAAQPDGAARPDDTVQQEAAAQREAASRQETAPQPDATTETQDVEASPAAGKGNGHGDGTSRTGRSRTSGRRRASGRRKASTAKKDASSDPAEASPGVTETTNEDTQAENGAQPEAADRKPTFGRRQRRTVRRA